MSDRRPQAAQRPVLLAIDELFVRPDGRALEQDVWSALGALDAACPAAIAPISAADLELLVAVAREWEGGASASDDRRGPVTGAVRRLAHVLGRYPAEDAATERARPAARDLNGRRRSNQRVVQEPQPGVHADVGMRPAAAERR